mmetsp:Transcript_6749/g.13700  ORF Transcript_6749/g.13700 Transcript_6749/m.13700 type:complete len:137 (-) Transcript_6749:10-420(-)
MQNRRIIIPQHPSPQVGCSREQKGEAQEGDSARSKKLDETKMAADPPDEAQRQEQLLDPYRDVLHSHPQYWQGGRKGWRRLGQAHHRPFFSASLMLLRPSLRSLKPSLMLLVRAADSAASWLARAAASAPRWAAAA